MKSKSNIMKNVVLISAVTLQLIAGAIKTSIVANNAISVTCFVLVPECAGILLLWRFGLLNRDYKYYLVAWLFFAALTAIVLVVITIWTVYVVHKIA